MPITGFEPRISARGAVAGERRAVRIGPAMGGDEVDIDPDTNVWQRLRLMLMYLLVPEGQL